MDVRGCISEVAAIGADSFLCRRRGAALQSLQVLPETENVLSPLTCLRFLNVGMRSEMQSSVDILISIF